MRHNEISQILLFFFRTNPETCNSADNRASLNDKSFTGNDQNAPCTPVDNPFAIEDDDLDAFIAEDGRLFDDSYLIAEDPAPTKPHHYSNEDDVIVEDFERAVVMYRLSIGAYCQTCAKYQVFLVLFVDFETPAVYTSL